MIIDQLASIGAFVSQEEFEPTTFEWSPEKDAPPITFDIAVKKEASVADFEFINMVDMLAENRSVMARSVHRLVRIRAINGNKVEQEQLSLADCGQLKPSLLLSFFGAIGTQKNDTTKKAVGKPRAPARARKR